MITLLTIAAAIVIVLATIADWQAVKAMQRLRADQHGRQLADVRRVVERFHAQTRLRTAEAFMRAVMQRYSGVDDDGNEESFADAAADVLRAWRKKAECDKAPAGWRCTRGPHADGPCAAVPDHKAGIA